MFCIENGKKKKKKKKNHPFLRCPTRQPQMSCLVHTPVTFIRKQRNVNTFHILEAVIREYIQFLSQIAMIVKIVGLFSLAKDLKQVES